MEIGGTKMFQVGQYKVEFRHKHNNFFEGYDEQPDTDIRGETSCIISRKSNGEFFKIGTVTVTTCNGEKNSKNCRRKKSLADNLLELFPSENSRNKKIREHFWQAYSNKRGGLEDCLLFARLFRRMKGTEKLIESLSS